MAKPRRREKKSEPSASTERRVLPMELQVGDRLSDETGEYGVIGRPFMTAGGRLPTFASSALTPTYR
jgi:hypothetical protein